MATNTKGLIWAALYISFCNVIPDYVEQAGYFPISINTHIEVKLTKIMSNAISLRGNEQDIKQDAKFIHTNTDAIRGRG